MNLSVDIWYRWNWNFLTLLELNETVTFWASSLPKMKKILGVRIAIENFSLRLL